MVEVTTHPDEGRLELMAARKWHPRSALGNEWHVLALDSRFLESYASGNSFGVNSVAGTLADVLACAEAEEADLDNFDRVGGLCEAEIVRTWKWARNDLFDADPPLTLQIVDRNPAEAGKGGVWLWVAPGTHNLRKVVDVSDLAAAIQQCIDDKLDRNQWGDTPDQKWLVIVLDRGEPADQLREAFEFDDCRPEFSGLTFAGIDQVWVVAFDGGEFSVLRFTGSAS